MPTQTTTATSGPPAYLQPFLQGAATAGTQLYNQGPQQFYPGQSVVPFAPQTNQAMNMQQQRAMGGSPLVSQAQQSTLGTLQGNFLSPDANPYLQKAFDPVAANINRTFDTAMARSGRDLTGNIGARASQIGQAANQFFGQNYQAERDRMMQASNQAIPLANQDYFDIAQLGQVGAQVQDQAGRIQQDNMQRFNFAQNAPWENLNRYMGVLTGAPYGQTTAQSVNMPSNPWGSAMGGALGGYALTGNPWGALTGGLGGYFGG